MSGDTETARRYDGQGADVGLQVGHDIVSGCVGHIGAEGRALLEYAGHCDHAQNLARDPARPARGQVSTTGMSRSAGKFATETPQGSRGATVPCLALALPCAPRGMPPAQGPDAGHGHRRQHR
jgi:hypothetical protein